MDDSSSEYSNNVVTISGMFGAGETYFADNPVVIEFSGLEWPDSSPFKIVRVEVIRVDRQGQEVALAGEFHADTGGQTTMEFDVSSALRAMWAGYNFDGELNAAKEALSDDNIYGAISDYERHYIPYSLRVYTEYLDSTDGELTVTQYEDEDGNTLIPGGQCLIGGRTELERSLITDTTKRDVSLLEGTNTYNGDASTKPHSPERVGSESITSWVDVAEGGTNSTFYPKDSTPSSPGITPHAPLVLRDSVPYVDFLFVNRRGAVETCSGQMLEAMDITVETQQYTRVERPTFSPSRSLMAIASGGRRSWAMSSGYQTREWAEWWTLEFLMAHQWWMRYPLGGASGTFVPVTVEPAKKNTNIYDRTKQQMPSVEFTVTLALEG